MEVKLHPHQKDAIEKMHNGCVLWGGGGTGKTITSLAYAMLRESDKQIVVVTTAKVRDTHSWEKEAAKLRIRRADIQVTSWNKINDLVDYKDHFFIFDEQRIVGSGAWVKAFHKIARSNRWILLSATPGDTWSDYSALFIANGWYKNITEFRREHAVYSRFTTFPKITSWRNEGRLQKYRKKLLVEMPMVRHTTRHIEYVPCDYDVQAMDRVRKQRWNIYEDRPIENASELYSVMRKVVSTDASRTRALTNLLKKHPKLIVFYNYNYELEILREVCEDFKQASQFTTSGLTSETASMSKSKPSGQTHDRSSNFIEMPMVIQSRFEESLPPWEMTDEEIASTLDQWLAKYPAERKAIWESKTSTNSKTRNQSTSKSSVLSLEKSASTSSSEGTPSRAKTSLWIPRSSVEPPHVRTVSLSEASTKSSQKSTEPRTSTSSSGEVWGEDRDAGTGTPGPRLERAEYEFESAQRKESSWRKTDLLNSATSTISHPSQKVTQDISSTMRESGTTEIRKSNQSPKQSPKQSTTSGMAATNKSPKKIDSTPTVSSIPTSFDKSSDTFDDITDFDWAEWNGHKHEDIPDTDRWVYLVQYQSGAEGWNCTETDAMAFWSLTYSWKLYEQAQCRIDRLNTPFKDLHYKILTADSPAERPVMAALTQKKDFQPK